MNFNMKKAATSPFSGLFSRGASAKAAKAEDEKDKDEEMENSESDDKDDDKEKDKAKKAKAKADKSDDDERAEDDGDDAEASAEDDGDDENEKEKSKASASATAAERTRWVSVLSSKATTGKGEAACTMLAQTDMSAEQISAVLEGLPAADAKASRRSLDERMQSQARVNPGLGGNEKPAEGPQATATAMMSVYDRAVGRSK